MTRIFFLSALLASIPALSWADGYFGTREEAETLAKRMIQIVEKEGVEAAIKAMHDPGEPFVGSRMGVNLFSGSTVVADNREPETIAADYSETADLTGSLVWPLISTAAEAEEDAHLKWYHYDTQEEYDYKCFSKRSSDTVMTVMVCR